MTQTKLWNRDFTILTLGSAVTMLGHALAGFGISLLVLDFTGSVFLYSLYLVAYFLPMVVMPLIAGPWLDSFSRSKVVYISDFISSGIYLGVFLLLRAGYFSYIPFMLGVMVIGAIDSVYMVAYDSLYPTLVSPGNFGKAYSISSLLYPLASMMTPVASWVYQRFGIAPLFAANFICFLVAAIFETQIHAPETYREGKQTGKGIPYLMSELREGLGYIRSEKGLMIITAYFFFSMLTGSSTQALWLPWFKSAEGPGVMIYSYVTACSVAGRFVGGLMHYKLHYPVAKKFAIALFVYITLSFLEGGFMFCPVPVMMLMCFLTGVLGVTSYNIRISATQSYLPESYRGRFNGCFQMITNAGSIVGQLASGILGEYLPLRYLVVGFMALSLVACLSIMVPGREHVKAIYNRDV